MSDWTFWIGLIIYTIIGIKIMYDLLITWGNKMRALEGNPLKKLTIKNIWGFMGLAWLWPIILCVIAIVCIIHISVTIFTHDNDDDIY